MELGPIQKLWVKSLREHPERQTDGVLGVRDLQTGDYKACCLGEGLICLNRFKGKKIFWSDQGELVDIGENADEDETSVLTYSYDQLGLRDEKGSFKGISLENYQSLAEANDNRVSWTEIADFIEAHPEAVFSKSV